MADPAECWVENEIRYLQVLEHNAYTETQKVILETHFQLEAYVCIFEYFIISCKKEFSCVSSLKVNWNNVLRSLTCLLVEKSPRVTISFVFNGKTLLVLKFYQQIDGSTQPNN